MKILGYIQTIMLVIFSLINCSAQNRTILISGGNSGGAYDCTSNFFCEVLNQSFDSISFISSTSTGSIENYKRLKNGYADLIIAQRDIAVEEFFNPISPFKNQEIILPLFTESFNIVVRGTFSKKITTEEFLKLTQNTNFKIGIGPRNSASNNTFNNIKAILGWNVPTSRLVEESYNDIYIKFNQNNIQAFLIFGILPLSILDNCDDCGIVSFNEKELGNILDRLPQLEITKEFNPFSKLDSANYFSTVGTWSLLIGRSGGLEEKLGENISAQVIDTIIRASSKIKYPKLRITTVIPSEFEVNRGQLKSIKQANEFFRGIEINANTLNKIHDTSNWMLYLIVVVIFLLLAYITTKYVFLLSSKLQDSKNMLQLLILRYKHWFILGFILIFGLALTAWAIWLSELSFFVGTKIKPSALNMKLDQYVSWFLLCLLTGVQEGVVLNSISGRLFFSFAYILIVGSGTYGVGSEIKFILNQSKRMKGEKALKIREHFVIIGCNNRTADLVKTIHHAYQKFLKQKMPKVVIIHPEAKKYVHEDNYLKKYWNLQKIEYFNVQPTKEQVLHDASVLSTKAVIIIPEDDSDESDVKSLYIATKLSRFSAMISNDLNDRLYVIAQVNNSEYIEELKNAHVNEVHCNSTLINGILTQGIINPGVEDVMENVISFNEQNELYSLDLREYKGLREKTYDELLIQLRKYNILLVGIRVVHYEETTKTEILDKDLKQKLNKKYQKTSRSIPLLSSTYEVRSTIINPINLAEKSYKTDDDDILLVLSMDKSNFKKLKKI